MSDLRLEQIVVSRNGPDETETLYGLDENGSVWCSEPGGKWSKLPMTKAEGEE